MKVEKEDIVSHTAVARGLFIASFAAFIFTSLFATGTASLGYDNTSATASVYNSNYKVAMIQAQSEVDQDDGGSYGGTVVPPTPIVPPTTITNPEAQPASVSIISSLPKVAAGSQVKLSWKSENVSSCSLKKDGVSVSTYTSSSQFSSGPLTKTTNFTIECQGISGIVSKSVTINVPTVLVPTVSFKAEALEVNYKGQATLSWTSTNAKSCTVKKDGIVFSSKINMASIKSGVLVKDAKFTINCVGSDGITSISAPEVLVKVKSAQKPTVTLSVSTRETSPTSPINVTWSTQNANKCTVLKGQNPIGQTTSGTLPTVKVTESTVIWITCSGDAGTVVDAIPVSVN